MVMGFTIIAFMGYCDNVGIFNDLRLKKIYLKAIDQLDHVTPIIAITISSVI